MAVLQELGSDRRVTLRSRHTIGRAATCNLVLDDRRVSSEHAVISWTGDGWVVLDRASRNGTWLEGAPIPRGVPMPLREGAVVAFGGDQQRWRVLSVEAPVAMARSADGERLVLASFGMLALPDEDDVEVTVFMDAGGRWMADFGERVQEVADTDVLGLSDGPWVLDLPVTLPETIDSSISLAPRLDEIALAFAVSRDQEYVEVEVVHGHSRTALRPRADLELLLQLARLRLQDRDAETPLPEAERGWVYRDDLLRMLAITENTLHQRVFRAREQLARVGVEGAAGVVERRLPTGQIRIGVADLTIRDL